MAFDVAAVSYDRFMGRYSAPLARLLLEQMTIADDAHVLDVGCGPGALTGELVARFGADHVAAVDPSEPFLDAIRERFPGVDARLAGAERMPFPDEHVDAAFANLVVPFMADPRAGVREMRRVVREGGVIAATAWNHGRAASPLAPFWRAALEVVPDAHDESRLALVGEGELVTLFTGAGLREVQGSLLPVSVRHATFAEWWEPYTLGVGPAGDFMRGLDDATRTRIEQRAHGHLGDGPFEVNGSAWCAVGYR